MIIVKHKNGDSFVNEKNIFMFEHIRTANEVFIKYDAEHTFFIRDVESVTYTTTMEEYKSDGSEIEDLKKEVEDTKNCLYRNRVNAMMFSDKVVEYDYFIKRIQQAMKEDDLTLGGLKSWIEDDIKTLNKELAMINERYKEMKEGSV